MPWSWLMNPMLWSSTFAWLPCLIRLWNSHETTGYTKQILDITKLGLRTGLTKGLSKDVLCPKCYIRPFFFRFFLYWCSLARPTPLIPSRNIHWLLDSQALDRRSIPLCSSSETKILVLLFNETDGNPKWDWIGTPHLYPVKSLLVEHSIPLDKVIPLSARWDEH